MGSHLDVAGKPFSTSNDLNRPESDFVVRLRREHLHKGLELLTAHGCLSLAHLPSKKQLKLHWDAMGDDEALGGRGSNVAQAPRPAAAALRFPRCDPWESLCAARIPEARDH